MYANISGHVRSWEPPLHFYSVFQVTGNKMTSLNLATIFGPNLLHKQKSTDKEFTVQSSARAEESTAIIAVVQKMIENYEALFMVRDVSVLLLGIFKLNEEIPGWY